MTETEEKIFALVISDIHEKKDELTKVVNYCKEKSITPDFIFCLGDTVTISQGHQADEDICREKEKEIQEYFTLLESLCPNLIYLPGNHDPETLFREDPPKLTENSVNLHLKTHEIKKNLLLAGLGGSICNFKTDETMYHTFQNLDTTKICWKGYPYIDSNNNPNFEKSDEMFKNDLDKLKVKIGEDYQGDILVLTHIGPFISKTSNPLNTDGDVEFVYGGSPALNNFLLGIEGRIIGNLHGHSHCSPGVGKVHNIKIYNPGSVKLGNFGFVTIEKTIESNYRWVIKQFRSVFP